MSPLPVSTLTAHTAWSQSSHGHRETHELIRCLQIPDATQKFPLDSWISAFSKLQKMGDIELAQYRSDAYMHDMKRLPLRIQTEEIHVDTTLHEIDQKILALLQTYWIQYRDDHRVLHYMRCQLQNLMTQSIFMLNRPFVEKYKDSYTKKEQILAGFADDFKEALALRFKDNIITIVATCKQNVLALPGLQEKGYDAQRVTITIDLQAVDPKNMLLSCFACNVTVEFHGFTQNFSKIKEW